MLHSQGLSHTTAALSDFYLPILILKPLTLGPLKGLLALGYVSTAEGALQTSSAFPAKFASVVMLRICKALPGACECSLISVNLKASRLCAAMKTLVVFHSVVQRR